MRRTRRASILDAEHNDPPAYLGVRERQHHKVHRPVFPLFPSHVSGVSESNEQLRCDTLGVRESNHHKVHNEQARISSFSESCDWSHVFYNARTIIMRAFSR